LREYFRHNEILSILCIQIVLMMMGMGLVSPILPQYARSFGVSITMVGFLITAFGFARIVMNIPAGRLADRLGRRPVLMANPVLFIIGSTGCGFAGSFGQLVTFRFIQGVGSAVFTTSAMVMAIDISTPANRGQMMSFY
jgi:MFS transporter, DHA1 family, multidrug resistance protein